MNTVTDQCLVIKVQAYKEKAALVTLFTAEHGKITVIISNYKDPQKKWSAALQSFSLVTAECVPPKQGGLWKIRSIVKEDMSGAVATFSAYLLLEALQLLLREEHALPSIWQIIKTAIRELDQQKTICIVLIKILTNLGYLPDLSHCTITQQKHTESGGVWKESGEIVKIKPKCADCHQLSLRFEQIKVLSFWQRESFENAQKVIIDDDFLTSTLQHLATIIEHVTGKEIRTRKMLCNK